MAAAYYILLLIFLLLNMTGLFLILLRTGDYDADMFTKILGWILFTPSLIMLMYYFKWTGLFALSVCSLITFLLKRYYKKGTNEYTY